MGFYAVAGLAVACAMASVGGCRKDEQVPVWKTEGIPPAAYASKEPLSAARWIWSGPRCTKQQTVCFRHRFEMARAEAIKLQIRADDFIDGVYLNDQPISVKNGNVSADELSKAAKEGANVLALQIRNGSQVAGVIYRILRAGDGALISVSSSAVKCADEAAKDWMRIDFDDSEWKPAFEHGDVTVPPWSRHSLSFVKSFMSGTEWTNYQETLKTSAANLPASLATEPEPDAHIVYRGWMPKIEVNGRDLEPNFALPLAIDLSPHPA